MEYYKIGLVFGAVCVFAGVIELIFLALSKLTNITNLYQLQFIAIVIFSFSSIVIGGIAIGKIFKKPMMSVFVCGECQKAFQEELALRKHYPEHLIKK